MFAANDIYCELSMNNRENDLNNFGMHQILIDIIYLNTKNINDPSSTV